MLNVEDYPEFLEYYTILSNHINIEKLYHGVKKND